MSRIGKHSESHSSLCFLHLFCPHQFFQQLKRHRRSGLRTVWGDDILRSYYRLIHNDRTIFCELFLSATVVQMISSSPFAVQYAAVSKCKCCNADCSDQFATVIEFLDEPYCLLRKSVFIESVFFKSTGNSQCIIIVNVNFIKYNIYLDIIYRGIFYCTCLSFISYSCGVKA